MELAHDFGPQLFEPAFERHVEHFAEELADEGEGDFDLARRVQKGEVDGEEELWGEGQVGEEVGEVVVGVL